MVSILPRDDRWATFGTQIGTHAAVANGHFKSRPVAVRDGGDGAEVVVPAGESTKKPATVESRAEYPLGDSNPCYRTENPES